MEDIQGLERNLAMSFRTYSPNPDFVDSLKRRITTKPAIEIEYPQSARKAYVSSAIVIAGITMLFLILRKLFGAK